MRILGLDPGLCKVGWGLIVSKNNCRFQHVANGAININVHLSFSKRLAALYSILSVVLSMYNPDEAAIEGIFTNINPYTALRLSHARGTIILATTQASIPISEYMPSIIKKTLADNGKANKAQISVVVRDSLFKKETDIYLVDAIDALAVAMCHVYYRCC